MIPKQAIEKAVQGGYPNDWGFGTSRENEYTEYDWEQSGRSLVLQADFWQALGKALGWTRTMPSGRHVDDPSKRQFEMMEDEWKWNAHRFYDLILTEQPTAQFWESLLA